MLLDFNAFESRLDVFGIDIFAAFGDDHVFLTAEELQVPRQIETPEIAGQQPAVNDSFGGQLRIVEVVRHDRRALGRDFADAVSVGLKNAELYARQRLTYRIGPKWLQIVDGQDGAGFGEPVAIRNRNAEVIEKLQSRGLHESATGDEGNQVAAECLVNPWHEIAAELHVRLFARKKFVD